MTHIAIMHDTGEVIASGKTFRECSDNADKTGVWVDILPALKDGVFRAILINLT